MRVLYSSAHAILSKVGQVSPCFKKVGTSDYIGRGHFVKFMDDLEPTLTTFLWQAFFISSYYFHQHSGNLAIIELNKGQHSVEHL